ncbi:hypothetical protein HanXRQr2_Chr07g0284341 [Helianthus annuus]|uniref:Uncharacterized protein n=1 Tax=Helianthus annuus TaxID=4232 RepID=A0A9K3IJX2_HELAN|nr:hypothetical protein HanXRQr2_Chr07g0284341 [Helianthus annuus]KAJ0903886.1 hypothetical protein HanPSC8_Chr07g0275241 [Helianthus annuus]
MKLLIEVNVDMFPTSRLIVNQVLSLVIEAFEEETLLSKSRNDFGRKVFNAIPPNVFTILSRRYTDGNF